MDIKELLERGLYHYGLGEVDKALELWKQVLALDPENDTAREYIQIETGRAVEATPSKEVPVAGEYHEPGPVPEPARSAPLSPEFIEGQQYLQRGEWETAMHKFGEAHRSDSSNPMYWAHVELSRARLIKEVIDQMGGMSSIPALTVPLNELVGRKSFTQEEGFVLSLISGETGFEDVISLSPLPRFQTYHIIYRLLSEGLVKIQRGLE